MYVCIYIENNGAPCRYSHPRAQRSAKQKSKCGNNSYGLYAGDVSERVWNDMRYVALLAKRRRSRNLFVVVSRFDGRVVVT